MRILAMEQRRSHLTAAKAWERFIAEEEADDANLPADAVLIRPGHSADLPHSGNRPPRM